MARCECRMHDILNVLIIHIDYGEFCFQQDQTLISGDSSSSDNLEKTYEASGGGGGGGGGGSTKVADLVEPSSGVRVPGVLDLSAGGNTSEMVSLSCGIRSKFGVCVLACFVL
jgi:hypothetical protein